MKFSMRSFLTFGLIVILTLLSASRMTGRPYQWDALENAVASYHLWSTGTMSVDGTTPTFFREPLPIAITALHIGWLTDIPTQLNRGPIVGPVQHGERVSQVELAYPADLMGKPRFRQQISYVNLYAIAGGLCAVWWVCWLLTGSYVASCAAILLSWVFFYFSGYFIYRPMSEYLASMFLLTASGFMVLMFRRPSWQMAIVLGVLLGMLSLTKGAVWYVSLVAIPLMVLLLVWFKVRTWRVAVTMGALCMLTLSMVVMPWMFRNHHHFGEFAISERAGLVLLTRAFKDQMTANEFHGAFYVYAPLSFKQSSVFRELFGLNEVGRNVGVEFARLYRSRPGDNEAAERGDLEAATSYFHKAIAYQNRLKLAGVEDVDREVKSEAMRLIVADPISHLKLTITFAWRGIWSFGHPDPIQPSSGSGLASILNFGAFLSLLLLPVLAFVAKRQDWLAFSLLGGGLFWFYALLTHFIPRYSAPMIPLAVIAMIVLLVSLWGRQAPKLNHELLP